MTTTTGTTAENVWRRKRQWTDLAITLSHRIRRRQIANLGFVVTAAFFGAVASLPATPHGWAIASAILAAAALSIAGFIQYKGLSAELTDRRGVAWAVSESLKSEIYRYLARVQPYDGHERDYLLLMKQREQEQEQEEEAARFLKDAQQQPPNNMPLPRVTGFHDYVTDRVQAQSDWHIWKARQHKNTGERIRTVQIAATVAAVAVAAVVPFLDNNITTGITGAVAIFAAVSAFLGAAQHDRIAAKYAKVGHDLQLLLIRIGDGNNAAARSDFVDDVERVLATVNR